MKLYGVMRTEFLADGYDKYIIDNRLYIDKIQAQSALDSLSKEYTGDYRLEEYEVNMEDWLKTYIDKVTEIVEATMKGSEYYIEITRDVFDYKGTQIMTKGGIFPVTRIKFNERWGGLEVYATYSDKEGCADIGLDHIGRLGRQDTEGYCKLVKKEDKNATN